jgi:N utilization substance protein A
MAGNPEILRLVESIHREKDVSREIVFAALESALTSACKKRPGGAQTEIAVHIDRDTGEIIAMDGNDRVSVEDLGRIAAQTAKQVLIQRIREAERDIVFDEYSLKAGKMITGTVQRFDRGNTIVINLGKVEGLLPRSEQIFNENYNPGERIRAIITDVKKRGNKVVISLSRISPLLVRELFMLEVPEISDKIIEIKDIVREPGIRTKIAVNSVDPKVDCVGACVGVRGNRIRNIVNELNALIPTGTRTARAFLCATTSSRWRSARRGRTSGLPRGSRSGTLTCSQRASSSRSVSAYARSS